jgi:gamma-glutamyltranspeptidase
MGWPMKTLYSRDRAVSVASSFPTACRGVQVWEVPPPTHGLAALIGLNILEGEQYTLVVPRLFSQDAY